MGLVNFFVVQAVSRALRPYCKRIVADASGSLHKLRCVQHFVAHFEGDILENSNLLDIIEQLHPTPAVGGVPCGQCFELFARA